MEEWISLRVILLGLSKVNFLEMVKLFYEKQWNCRGDNRKYTETALQRRDIGKYTGTCLEELLGNLLKTYKRDFGKCTETVERN